MTKQDPARRKKTSRPGHTVPQNKRLLLMCLLILPALLGCWITDVGVGYNPPQSELQQGEYKSMQATGSFLANPIPGWTYTFSENTINLRWSVSTEWGDTLPEVKGEGKIRESEPSRGCEHVMDLVFTGTLTPDGKDFTGSVHITGIDSCPDGYSSPIDYTTDWTAIRRGDSIEGSVVALGPFLLDILPAAP